MNTHDPFYIYIWHYPDDREFCDRLADDLCSRGFEINTSGEKHELDEPSFAADWQISRSDCVVFLISKIAVESLILQTEAEKVMRSKNTLLVPAYLDDSIRKQLPLILWYIQPLEFFRDYSEAFGNLLVEIDRKTRGNRSTLRATSQPWEKPFRWLIEHFRRYLTLSPLTFCWQITVENLIISLITTGLIYLIWQPAPRTNLENISAATYLWSIIILGPIVETIFLQALPMFIARSLGLKFFGQLLFSIVPFAVLHFSRSISAGIGAGIIGGFYSAFTYVVWQKKSNWTALWVTFFSHCLYNLALFAMLIGEF